jgi:nucleotide-binding universal stress UspA family protein
MNAEFNNIIVPVDGSESSQRAARLAVRLSKAMGSKIAFIYVFPSPTNDYNFLSMTHPEDTTDQNRKETARKVFDKIHQAIGGNQQGIEEKALFGDPAEEIIHYLEKHPGTMTVIGRRGLSGFESLLLGSVSEKVMRHASGPVTIVH